MKMNWWGIMLLTAFGLFCAVGFFTGRAEAQQSAQARPFWVYESGGNCIYGIGDARGPVAAITVVVKGARC